MADIREKIRQELFDIEADKGIHLVNARQRGSEMLGVSHDNSDYDVMFLFAQDASRYAQLDGHIDSIHDPSRGENGLIDLHGWNIDKFGELAADSNPNAIEYCRPEATEYISFHDGGVFDAVRHELQQNFNHMSLYHHYISMAKSNYEKYVASGNDCTKGRQFYIARAIACAAHIRRGGTLPPMDVSELSESPHIKPHLQGTLRNLADSKRSGNGSDEYHDVVGYLYTDESDADMDPTDARIRQPSRETIDAFIREAIVR